MIQNFKEDYKSPFPIVRFYFRKIMSTLIEMLNNVEQDAPDSRFWLWEAIF